jgi:hypothetical protein
MIPQNESPWQGVVAPSTPTVTTQFCRPDRSAPLAEAENAQLREAMRRNGWFDVSTRADGKGGAELHWPRRAWRHESSFDQRKPGLGALLGAVEEQPENPAHPWRCFPAANRALAFDVDYKSDAAGRRILAPHELDYVHQAILRALRGLIEAGALVRSRATGPNFVVLCRNDGSVANGRIRVFKNGVLAVEIEILASGRQVVCFALHPSGTPYLWSDDRSPETFAVEDLPTIDEAGVATLRDGLSRELALLSLELEAPPKAKPAAPAPVGPVADAERQRNEAWFAASLKKLADTPHGARNRAVYDHGRGAGGLRGLPREEIEERTLAVILAWPDEAKTLSTFSNGLEDGAAQLWDPGFVDTARYFSDIEPIVPPANATMTPAPVAQRNRFAPERFADIRYEISQAALVKRLLPRKGLAAIYGKPGAFKSFVAVHLGLHVALGASWAGRAVTQAPVMYIGAEGAVGLRKRITGLASTRPDLPADLPFFLISAAPNLGNCPGDLAELSTAIEAAGVAPGLIVIDTLAASLGGADENNVGMTALVANCGALASRFDALVLIVAHSGLADDKRLRGHSSLHGGVDALLLCERVEGELSTNLTVQKCKDDASDFTLLARLRRVVIGIDEDGEEVSTLVVDRIEDGSPAATSPRAKSVPPSQRLLLEVLRQAVAEVGEECTIGLTSPFVRVVVDDTVRERYYARVAERPKPDDTPEKLAARQRQAFNSSIKALIDAQRILAGVRNDVRVLWLP